MSKQLLHIKMPPELRNMCVLLPNRDQLSVTVGVKATGQELFDQVCDALKIKDPHFFGISVVKRQTTLFRNKQYIPSWVELLLARTKLSTFPETPDRFNLIPNAPKAKNKGF